MKAFWEQGSLALPGKDGHVPSRHLCPATHITSASTATNEDGHVLGA